MRLTELLQFALGSLRAYPLRSGLTALGIAIGIAAVVLLTSIGEGVHRFVLAEFTQFGTHLLAVNPGRIQTHGVSPGVFGTTRPLSLDDAEALRRARHVRAVMPSIQGNARVEAGARARNTTILGVGPALPEVWRLGVQLGRFLPDDDPRTARAFVVLGQKVKSELFADRNPLGDYVRVGGYRYRVIGVMEPKGQILGFDLDDTVFIPAARALELFNREGLMEIDVLYTPTASLPEVVESVRQVLIERHGREDFTIVTQEQMLDVLGSVLNVLTFAVGALGGISLLVGGIGVLTIMTIAVSERTAEVGLLRALGARQPQILALFLGEAVVLAVLGGFAGLALGIAGAGLLRLAVPALPVYTSWAYALAALALSAVVGLAAGVFPARRAARLDPVEALRAE